MKHFFLTVLLAGAAQLASAQTFNWAANGGGPSDDQTETVAIDDQGNTYVAGYFEGSATFSGISLTGAGDRDIFIAKYSPTGILGWIKHVGGIGSDNANSIAVDTLGFIYVVGEYEGTVSFDSITAPASPSDEEMFLAKLDPAGNFLWVKHSVSSNDAEGYGVAVAPSGDIFVAGHFSGSASFDSVTLVSSGSADIFVAKYNQLGNAVWATKAGGAGLDEASGLALGAQQQVFVTGVFSGTATFGSTTVTGGLSSAFIAKFSSAGVPEWAQAASASLIESESIAADWTGTTFITGTFMGSATFGSTTLSGFGDEDFFLASYDSTGTLLWAKQGGGIDGDGGGGVTIGLDRRVYVTGGFEDNVTFDTISLSSNADEEVFIACFERDGKIVWLERAPANNSVDAEAIAINRYGQLAITGKMEGAITFDTITVNSSSPGLDDIYVAGYSTQMLATRLLTTTTFNAGSTTAIPFYAAGNYNPGNTFRVQLSNSSGSFANPVIIGSQAGTTSGTINVTLPASLPAGNGYRIRVVSTNPVLTGADNSVNLTVSAATASSESIISDGLIVFPNPSTGVLYLSGEQLEQNSVITITDLTGRIVTSQSSTSGAAVLDLHHLSNGVYGLQVQLADGKTAIRKVVLQH
jgi:hypothetical protein